MTDVHVNSVNTTVRATDSHTLLSQPVLDRIVQSVLEQLQADKDRQQRAEADRRLRSGVFSGSLGEGWK